MMTLRNRALVLRLIGGFKFFKGLTLIAVGLGALQLVHKDVALEVERVADVFRVDPDNRYLYWAAVHLAVLSERRLRELSIGTFFYAALFFTEGTGLLLLRAWAEYFTLIVTASLLPIEIYELVKHETLPKWLLLALNLAVVVYLALELRRHQSGARTESQLK